MEISYKPKSIRNTTASGGALLVSVFLVIVFLLLQSHAKFLLEEWKMYVFLFIVLIFSLVKFFSHKKTTDPAWISLFFGLFGFLWGFYTVYMTIRYWMGIIPHSWGLELFPSFLFIFIPIPLIIHLVLLIPAWLFLAESSRKELVASIKILLDIVTVVISFFLCIELIGSGLRSVDLVSIVVFIALFTALYLRFGYSVVLGKT